MGSAQISADQSDQPTFMNIINITRHVLMSRWSCKMTLTAALERVVVMLENLGYTSLKPEQENAIKKFVKGHDVYLVVLASHNVTSFCQCCLIY